MIVDFFRNIGRYILRPFFARYWRRLLLVLVLVYGILSIGHQSALFRSPLVATSPFEAFSENTALLLETSSALHRNGLGKCLPPSLASATYAPALFQLSILNKWQRNVRLLDSLFRRNETYTKMLEQTAVVSGAQVTSNQTVNWLHVLKIPAKRFNPDGFIEMLRPRRVQKSTYRDHTIYTLELDGQKRWTFALFRGLVLMSSTTILVESSIEQLDNISSSIHQNTAFRAVVNKKDKPTWNIYLNFKALPLLTNVVTTSNPKAILALQQLGHWMRLDAQFLEQDFSLSGALYPEPNNAFLKALARQQAPKNSRMIELLPSNLGAMLYLGWGDFNAFYKSYADELEVGAKGQSADFEKYIQPWLGQDAALFYEDPTDEENAFEKDKLVFTHSKDTSLTWELLDQYAQKKGTVRRYAYQNFEITYLPANDVLKPLFGKIINPLQQPYFTIIGEYIVWANSKTTLEGWIKSFNTHQVLLGLPQYNAFLKQSSEQANAYVLINTPNTNKFIQYLGRPNTLADLQSSWKGFKTIYPIGIKLHGQGDYFVTTLSASFNQISDAKKQVKATSAWQADLNSAAAMAPQVLRSHDGNCYVLVQDERRQVYLFDKNGENQWPAHLITNRPINSPIYEIDYYNNKELQYVFSTDSAIYVITKEGKRLNTIPLIHRAASGMLAIDHGKGPRFFIPCKNGVVYGYEETGKPMSGWQPLKGVGRAVEPMQYMHYQDKRYLLLLTRGGHCHAYQPSAEVLFKHAKLGHPINWGLDPSIGRAAAGQPNGKVKIINNKGRGFSLSAVPELKKKVQFLYADVIGDARKDYIRMDANQMVIHYYEKQTDEKGKIKDKLQKTPIYTIPEAEDRKIFAIQLHESEKELVGYWEPSTGSIGLLDARGVLQKGFPLAGTSTFQVVDLFNEQSNTLVVANNSRVYTYKLK